MLFKDRQRKAKVAESANRMDMAIGTVKKIPIHHSCWQTCRATFQEIFAPHLTAIYACSEGSP